MPAEIIRKIEEIALPIVEKNDAYIVEITVRGERSSKVVEIFLDSDTGITIEACSAISRELSVKLDEANLIQGRYRLDVSSPGLDKPLKLHRQYKKNKGRNCKVYIQHEGGIVIKEGVLENVDEKFITITSKGKSENIAFENIAETFIIPKFK